LLLILLTLTACAANTAAQATESEYCKIYKPVCTSDADSEETRDAVDKNNAAFEEICKPVTSPCDEPSPPQVPVINVEGHA